MTRSVFFSFHYQRDIFRVNVVRNHFLTKQGYISAGYWDHSLWEKFKRDGDLALKRLINKGLENTSVTVVLIGAATANRKWVDYEIEKSYERGNAMLGIYIHNIPSINGFRDSKGLNPFDYYTVEQKGKYSHFTSNHVPLSNYYPTYDWVQDNGYNNFNKWVEYAARAVGK